MTRAVLALAPLAALIASGAAAQQPAPRTTTTPPTTLAGIIEQSRRVGLPDTQVQGLYSRLLGRGVPEAEAQQVVAGEVETVRRGAAKQNFGAYVNQQIGRGLRGRDLSAAIKAEHQRRGVGGGNSGNRGNSGNQGTHGAAGTARDSGAPKQKPPRP
jgi:hypothetical protein